jgi:predicted DNA-binding protein (MmcQ/YjbR family)
MSMTAYSMTFRHTSPAELAVERLINQAFHMARELRHWWQAARQQEPRNAEELLAWADQFDATQPGFAAELRAMATRDSE